MDVFFFPQLSMGVIRNVVSSCALTLGLLLLSICLKPDSFSMGELCCRYNTNFSLACLSHFNGLDMYCLFTLLSGDCSSNGCVAGVTNTGTLKISGQWSE